MQALNRWILTLALSVVAAIALAQAPPKPGPWFTSKEVAPGVLRIEDHGSDNMYLVLGKSKALLVDTGLGVGRLADFVKTLTTLPVVVVNTHGHPDHAGGNNEFKTVYAHPAEFAAIRAFGTKESRQNTIARMTQGASSADTMSVDDAVRLSPAELVPIKGGHVFDLGGRKLEVVEQPGHTPGEIVLLDAAHHLVSAYILEMDPDLGFHRLAPADQAQLVDMVVGHQFGSYFKGSLLNLSLHDLEIRGGVQQFCPVSFPICCLDHGKPSLLKRRLVDHFWRCIERGIHLDDCAADR